MLISYNERALDYNCYVLLQSVTVTSATYCYSTADVITRKKKVPIFLSKPFSMEFNPSNFDGTSSEINVVISCIYYLMTTFIVSLTIKQLLRTYRERLTFVHNADNIKHYLTSLSMEIVEITEQYCYTMNIGISMITNEIFIQYGQSRVLVGSGYLLAIYQLWHNSIMWFSFMTQYYTL